MAEIQKLRVCIGNRFDSKNKVCQFWYELNENDEAFGASFSFVKFVAKGAVPGMIYLFTGEETEKGFSFYTQGAKQPIYHSQYKDRNLAMEWEIQHRKTNVVKAAQSKIAKIEPELRKALAPIRDAYYTTNAEGKVALIALVIQEIMRG